MYRQQAESTIRFTIQISARFTPATTTDARDLDRLLPCTTAATLLRRPS